MNKIWASLIVPTLAQNRFIASGGNPLRLRAVRVKRRGSSQSLERKGLNHLICESK